VSLTGDLLSGGVEGGSIKRTAAILLPAEEGRGVGGTVISLPTHTEGWKGVKLWYLLPNTVPEIRGVIQNKCVVQNSIIMVKVREAK